MITITNRKITIPTVEQKIGFTGDNKVETRQFEIADITMQGFNFKLDVRNKDGTKNIIDLVKTIVDGKIILMWEILESHVLVDGYLYCQIRAFADNELKWHSEENYFKIGASINATDSFPAILPSEFTQMEQRVTMLKNDVVASAEQVATNTIIVATDTAIVISDTNAVSIDKDTVIASKQATELLKSDVVTLKSDTQSLKTDCVGIYNQQVSLLSNTPTWYVKDTAIAMNAITTMKDSDFCIIISSDLVANATYRYFTKDITGAPLVTPTWVWITDLSLLHLTKSYLLGILQLPTVATSASYTDLINKPVRYESFITVTNGIWNYALSDKIILTTTNLISIANITNGAIGCINTTYDLTLPSGSKKAVDYDYIIATTGQSYTYTFLYNGVNYFWSRVVVI